MTSRISNKLLIAMVAVLLLLVGALGYALWQDSRSETIEFRIGETELEVITD